MSTDLDKVVLPPGEDFGYPSDDEDLREDIQLDTSFSTVVVVEGLPQVEPEKFDKLKGVLVGKLFAAVGTVNADSFFMPYDAETNKTKGFCFIEFSKPEEAEAAVLQLNGYRLDKNHVFSVAFFEEIEKFAQISDKYEPPSEKEAKVIQPPHPFKKRMHMRLLDKGGRDQFIVRYQSKTEIYWNDAKRAGPEIVYQRDNWTESFVQWSPQGNYLATMHRQGVAMWAGQDDDEPRDKQFQRISRFEHDGVMLIDFSPNEEYIVTWSPATRATNNRVVLRIFDVKNNRLMREFDGSPEEFSVDRSGGAGAMAWPLFKWAGGSKDLFFAKLAPSGNAINVYGAPDMMLLDKKSVRFENVKDFAWAPHAPVMAAFQSEVGNLPARIVLLSFPERTEIRQKNLFSVADVRLHWHPEGTYLAVRVDQHTKTKKSTYTTFQMFRMTEKGIPVDTLELPRKNDRVHGLFWEPHGTRFCVLHTDPDSPLKNRPDVSFFEMEDTATTKGIKQIKLLGTLKSKPCNRVFWSPRGKQVVLAGLGPLNGVLEFFSVDEMQILNTGEHFMCTDVEWDPTGRYVATVTNCTQQMENGYTVWTCHGKQLYRIPRDELAMFSWRPRPPTLLTPEQEKKVQKELKQYSKRYDEEDQALVSAADLEVVRMRESTLKAWEAWLDSRRVLSQARLAEAKAKYPRAYEEPKDVTIERVELEETLSVVEEVMAI